MSDGESDLLPLDGLVLLADIDKVREYCNKGYRECNEERMTIFQHDGKRSVLLSSELIDNPKTRPMMEKAFGKNVGSLLNSLEHKWGVHNFWMKDPSSIDELMDNVKYQADMVSLSVSPSKVNEASKACGIARSEKTCDKTSGNSWKIHEGLACAWMDKKQNGLLQCSVSVQSQFKILDFQP